MTEKIYIGDVGTLFRVNCIGDISTATLAQIKVQKPDGTKVEWTGSIINSTIIQYAIADGDLDQAGYYYAQAYVEIGTSKWSGAMFNFEVHNLFK